MSFFGACCSTGLRGLYIYLIFKNMKTIKLGTTSRVGNRYICVSLRNALDAKPKKSLRCVNHEYEMKLG